MLTGEMAREQIQDRVRAAAHDRDAATARRMRSSHVGSGVLASVANLRLFRRLSEEAPIRVARTSV